MVVLHWIHGNGKRTDAYVRKRVDEVQKLVRVECCHYVEFKLSLTDLLSRGLPFSEIIQNNLWLQGPSPLLLGDAAYSEFNPVQDGVGKKAPYQLFPCNFYKRRN